LVGDRARPGLPCGWGGERPLRPCGAAVRRGEH
jgi:hypothetical protein